VVMTSRSGTHPIRTLRGVPISSGAPACLATRALTVRSGLTQAPPLGRMAVAPSTPCCIRAAERVFDPFKTHTRWLGHQKPDRLTVAFERPPRSTPIAIRTERVHAQLRNRSGIAIYESENVEKV
jgi:hypothetical protein